MKLLLTTLMTLGLSSAWAEDTMSTTHSNSMHSMHDGMTMTGNADKDFISMMIKHHEDGIRMSETELKDGQNAQAKAFARKIVKTQTKEVQQMKRWQVKNP